MDNLTTGVPGLDTVLGGGVARGSQVLIVGPMGAGKTILATQMIFAHAKAGRRALFLTALTEASSKLIEHLSGLEYFDQGLLGDQVQVLNVQQQLKERGLDHTLSEILKEVVDRKIEILVIDSVRSLYELVEDKEAVQSFIFRLSSSGFQLGCTTLLVTDQSSLDPPVSLEAIISDTILHLEVMLTDKSEDRQLRVTKERGAAPRTGRHSYELTSSGLRVYPRIESRAVEVSEPEGDGRLGWGVPRLDELTGGGIPRHDSTLILGTTGIGKTTLCLHFVAEGIAGQERCLYLTFHETVRRLLRKAEGFGMELAQAVEAGSLKVAYVPPAGVDVDRVLNLVLDEISEHEVSRLVIDVLNPLERNASREGRYPEVVPALLNVLQAQGVTSLITREITQMVGQSLELGDTRETYWTPFDNIVLLRPVELEGRVSRMLSVLKMRNSDHDERFYDFDLGSRGIEIGDALQGLEGLLTGLPHRSG